MSPCSRPSCTSSHDTLLSPPPRRRSYRQFHIRLGRPSCGCPSAGRSVCRHTSARYILIRRPRRCCSRHRCPHCLEERLEVAVEHRGGSCAALVDERLDVVVRIVPPSADDYLNAADAGGRRLQLAYVLDVMRPCLVEDIQKRMFVEKFGLGLTLSPTTNGTDTRVVRVEIRQRRRG